ncbi:tetratricopeptide repeat protein [Treponema primitia]|uniref:tetratricopeptide repeat protein n=1 Tax=Treponema primitia TaxID=88058 RepID=UPI00397FCD14
MNRTLKTAKNRIFVVLLFLCGALLNAQSRRVQNLDELIKITALELETRLQGNTRLAITNIRSDSAALSDYIIEELFIALSDSGKIAAIDTNTLNRSLADTEINFQLSGSVSDETQVSIGKLLGVQQVLSGSFAKNGNDYQLQTVLLDVHTKRQSNLPALAVAGNQRINVLMAQKSVQEPLVAKNPVTAIEFQRRAEMHRKNKDHTNAIADLTNAIALGPQYITEIYLKRGNEYHKIKSFELAIADFTRVINLNSDYAVAYRNRGMSYAAVGEYNKALSDITRAIQIAANTASMYSAQGIIHAAMGEYNSVIDDANKALAIDPGNTMAYTLRSDGYYSTGEFDKCIEDLQQLIRLEPGNIEHKNKLCTVLIERGTSYGQQEEHTKALPYFNRAIALNLPRADTYANRGMAYYWLGDIEKAFADMAKAAQLDPNNTQIRSTLERFSRLR